MRILFILLILITTPSYSYADGNSFLSKCATVFDHLPERRLETGLCIGTIQGMRHMNDIYESKNGSNGVLFCIPEGVSAGQLIRTVIKYMEDNPSKLHEHEVLLSSYAFVDAYPCTKESDK
jgi:hypothetical protein